MIFITALLITLLMIVLPCVLGRIIAELSGLYTDDIFEKYGFSYIMGHVFMWAVFQLVAVPLILAKSRLWVVTVLWMLLLITAVIIGIMCLRKKGKASVETTAKTPKKESKIWLVFSLMLTVSIVGYQCYMYFAYTHIDNDDARFVVNAVDAYEKGTMFLSNPANGSFMGTWVGELVKDVNSPWSIYIAMISKLLDIYPTIFAHTVYPVFLLIGGYAAYYLLAKLIFDDRIKSVLMTAVVATINMSFGDSVYNQSYFTIVRIWQGKAVVAGVLIPFLTFMLMRLYKDHEKKANYVLIFLVNIAMCLMSGMGIFFSGILTGVCGLWFVLINKNRKSIIYVAMACIPTIIYGISYIMVK